MTLHGTRASYQRQRCRCVPCRASEATYRADLRRRHARGLPILGAVVSAVETRRQLRLLVTEYDTEGDTTQAKTEIARRLGIKDGRLRYGAKRIRVRTMLNVYRLYQMDILAGLADQVSA